MSIPGRTVFTLALYGAASFAGVSLAVTSSAQAAECLYVAHDWQGKPMADGHARAVKKSWACNRAERRCNRELERKRRHGKAGRGRCVRITNYP